MPGPDLRAPFDADFLARLEQLHLSARRIFSGRANAKHISRKLGTGTEFADHRAYAPGDDLRLLDWNVYARTDRLATKLFHQEEDRNLFFLVDVSASMAVEPAKFDYVRRLAAAVAYIGLYDMDRVYLMGFAGGITAARPVLRGRRAVFDAMHFLAGLQAAGPTDFRATSSDFISRHGGAEGLVLVFSDFMDPDGVVPAIDRLFAHGFEVLALQVVTPAELDPRLLGEWRLVNPEGGRPYTVHLTRRTLTRYRRAMREHGDRLRRHLAARRGGYVRATTATALEDMVLKELRAGHLLA